MDVHTMKAGMATDPGQSSRAKPVIMVGVVASLSGRIREAAKYLLGLSHPASTQRPTGNAIPEAGAAQAVADNVDAELTPTTSLTTAATADVNVGPKAANGVSQTTPDQQEIERRRELVRMLFNDFWNGAHDKPSAFVQRLDQAEDYMNARLETHGELWRLDANTRVMLGLPPRSSSRD
jgi:hypothetical protein